MQSSELVKKVEGDLGSGDPWSFWMYLPDTATDPVQGAIATTGALPNFATLLRASERLQPGDLCVDIGAGIGEFSLFAATACGCRVLALETSPAGLEAIRHSVELNRLEETVTTVELLPPASAATPRADAMTLESVNALLSDREPRMIRVNVAGLDRVALTAFKETLSRCRPSVILETQDGRAFNDAASVLRSQGYTYLGVSGDTTHHFCTNPSLDELVHQVSVQQISDRYDVTSRLADLEASLAAGAAANAQLQRDSLAAMTDQWDALKRAEQGYAELRGSFDELSAKGETLARDIYGEADDDAVSLATRALFSTVETGSQAHLHGNRIRFDVDEEGVCEITLDGAAMSRVLLCVKELDPALAEEAKPAVFLITEGTVPESWGRNRLGEVYRYLPADGGEVALALPDEAAATLRVRATRAAKRLPLTAYALLRPEQALSQAAAQQPASLPTARKPNAMAQLERSVSDGANGVLLTTERTPVDVDTVFTVNVSHSASQPSDKASLLLPCFYDATGAPLPGPYKDFHTSPKFGPYTYVRIRGSEAGEFEHAFRAPPDAASVAFQIQPWSQRDVEYTHAGVTPLCPVYEVQEKQVLDRLDRLLSRCEAQGSKLVLLTTTTKQIGDRHRANRPMQFAIEYALKGYTVVYVYYRFTTKEALPAEKYDSLVEMPNDIFHKYAHRIARSQVSHKYLLSSIPDQHSTYEIGLFSNMGWRVVYEARDDWEEFQNAGVGNWYHTLFEQYLCLNAHVVTAVSPPLIRKMRLLGAEPEKCHVVPNGAAATFLNRGEALRTERKASHKGHKVGYFGHLTEKWFDWDLLCSAARELPDVEFEIIGFDAPEDLDVPANMSVHDSMEQDALIDRSLEWEVALVPFKRSILSNAVDPIKCHEYLAIGLKVVASEMQQILSYPSTLTYRDNAEFVPLLRQALAWERTEEEWAAVEQHVAEGTWRHRSEVTLALAES